MSDFLLATKIHVPPLRGQLVSRPGLIQYLNDGINQNHRLTLISAPAGYGKSTLIAEWIHQLSLPVGWFSIEKEENSADRFWYYFSSTLATIPQLNQASVGRSILWASQAAPPPKMDALLANLVNQLANFSQTVVLVLDDLHEITENQIHKDLVFLIDHLLQSASGLNLVVASRMDPPWPLARWRARGELTEIRASGLRFTPDEASLLLNQIMQLGLSSQDICALQERTEGWIAGLQLAALSLQGISDASQYIRAFSGSHRYIMDFLVEEVILHQPKEIQNFLLRTSILDRLSGELCDAVTESGTYTSQAILEYLDRSNLFLIPLDDQRTWFRYHHLFSDILRARLYQSHADEVARLHLRASIWYENNRMINEAVRHAFSAQDDERAAELIELYAPLFWAESDTSIVKMAENLPPVLLLTRPRLGIYYAWLLILQGHLQEAIPLLNNIDQKLTTPSADSDRGWLHSMVALLRAYLNLPAEDLTSQSLPDYHVLEEIPEEDLVLRNAADILYGMLLGRRGELDRAGDVLDKCIQREIKPDGSVAIPTAVPFLVRIRMMQGRLHTAETLCRDMLRPIEKIGIKQIYTAGSLNIALGEIFYEWNRLDEAEGRIREGISDNEPWDSIFADVAGYLVLARVLQAKGNHEEAMTIADKLEKRLEGHASSQELKDEINTLKVRLQLANGNIERAAEWADKIHLSEPFTFRHEHYLLTLSRIRLAQGKYDEAEHFLDGMASLAEAGNRTTRQLKFTLLLAVTRHGQNRMAEALSLLDHCLSLAEAEGYIRLFLNVGEPARQLLIRYLDENNRAHRAYARGLINAFAEPIQSLSVTLFAQGLVEPLTARELEVLHLLAAGYSNRQIAEQLILSQGTVKYYVHAILAKLQVHSRTQAIVVARKLSLV